MRPLLRSWAKAGLFQVPVAGWVLKGMSSVPVKRRMDLQEGDDEQKVNNDSLYAESLELLNNKKHFAIFPEGTSYTLPSLLKFKTGAARLALEFVMHNPNKLDLKVIAGGITYTDKSRFGSLSHIKYAPAMIIGDKWAKKAREDLDVAAKELSSSFMNLVEQVTVNCESDEEYENCVLAAKLIPENPPVSYPNYVDDLLLISQTMKSASSRTDLNASLGAYRRMLNENMVTDSAIFHADRDFATFSLVLFVRFLLTLVSGALAAPGILMSLPYFILMPFVHSATIYAEERSTYKVFFMGVFTPIYIFVMSLAFYILDSLLLALIFPVAFTLGVVVMNKTLGNFPAGLRAMMASLRVLMMNKETLSNMKEMRKTCTSHCLTFLEQYGNIPDPRDEPLRMFSVLGTGDDFHRLAYNCPDYHHAA
eukprot:TRINITY_DN45213_c0_g1_i1.p1 TRINITY_DN45213_c0_g1~~TRINITY_DN45213_c0_g1_i1.p1  ORF type:complete len:486 (+),score=100.47 TRINITY_DN45213_c0_g1_i1:194-1459(+)